jgi:hypothetical protein
MMSNATQQTPRPLAIGFARCFAEGQLIMDEISKTCLRADVDIPFSEFQAAVENAYPWMADQIWQ